MNDLEWPMLLYCVIYYEKLKNVMQRTEKIALISDATLNTYKPNHHKNAWESRDLNHNRNLK